MATFIGLIMNSKCQQTLIIPMPTCTERMIYAQGQVASDHGYSA